MSLITLTVTAKNGKNLSTSSTQLFESTRISSPIESNLNSTATPAITGNAQFMYNEEGTEVLYVVNETVAAIQAAAADGTITANVGAVSASTVSVSEEGDGSNHITKLTLTDFNIGAIAAMADEAIGALLYTLPAGVQAVKSVYIDLDLTNTDGNIDADTPDLGLGTTVATGAVAVLSGTAAFENVLTGQTMNDCNGTDEEALVESTLLVNAAADKTIYLNVADGWGGAETALVANGAITIEWTTLD